MSKFDKVPPLLERAKGRWHGVLTAIGIDKSFLTKRNGPCPMCGGRDRWRWTDFKRDGDWICSKCGSGTGIELVKAHLGLDFAAAAVVIEAELPKVDATAPKRDEAELRASMRKVWGMGHPVTTETPVGRYLRRRGIDLAVYPKCLRYVPSLWHVDGASPAMIAQVVSPDGRAANIHRTWVTEAGEKRFRALMAGTVPGGSAVRLSPVGPVMGFGEGIETVMRAGIRFGLPGWSMLNEGNLQKLHPPAGVEEVHVWGDNDPTFVGQAAAYVVARDIRLRCDREKREMRIRVAIPAQEGSDWGDEVAE